MNICLVARAKTRNQGNVALSRVWQTVIGQAFPQASVTILERIPSGLKRYRLRDIARHADPIAAFERLAFAIAARTVPNADLSGDPIMLDTSDAPPARSKLVPMANLRSRMARLGLFDRSFGRRMGKVASCDMMVMVGAGEFYAKLTDTPFQYMLDLRVAQLLGLRTAFVNTSLELTDPLAGRVVAHVLDRCDLVLFRDEDSVDRFRAVGGQGPVSVLPDAAMLSGPLLDPAPTTGRIGIAISAMLKDGQADYDQWRRLAIEVRQRGLDPVFVSNEWATDERVFGPWLKADGFTAIGKGLDVDDYVAMLSGLDVLISARLHSAVLGVVAGTPVVPVEIGTRKLSGLFDQLKGFPPVIAVAPGWIEIAVERASAYAAAKQSYGYVQQAIVKRARDRLAAQIVAALSPLAPAVQPSLPAASHTTPISAFADDEYAPSRPARFAGATGR